MTRQGAELLALVRGLGRISKMVGTKGVWPGRERPASPLGGRIWWVLMAPRAVAQRWTDGFEAPRKRFTSTN